jgi:hypothetical protein
MLELCFSDSVKGGLVMAQNCGGPFTGTISVFATGLVSRRARREALKKARVEAEERARRAIPLGGRPTDVLGLSLMLSMGDIQAELTEDGPRFALLRRWLTADPWGELEEAEDAIRQFWENCLADLAALKARAPSEPVRIWVDDTPDSQCGLRFAAELLSKTAKAVTMVPLPRWQAREDHVAVQYDSWGEVCPEDFGSFLPLEAPLPPAVLQMLAGQWRELQRENAPLRAMINGQLLSVGEDFYDPLLRQVLADQPCKVAQAIGQVLGRYRPGIGDWLLACRIRAMLESGELRMVQKDPQQFYNCLIARN